MDAGDVFSRRRALTFEEAAPIYLAFAHGRKRESTLSVDRARLLAISREPWATTPLRDLEPRALLPWVERRKAEVSVASVNRDLCICSALYRWAILAGHADMNPFRALERFSERGRERETYLIPAEARSVIAAAEPEPRRLILAALATGMRRRELFDLERRDVDLECRAVRVPPPRMKGGRGRFIPIGDYLHGVLVEALAFAPATGTTRVFVQRSGRPWKRGAFANALRRAVERSCVPAEKRRSVTMHTLRHSAASLLVQSGVPLAAVGAILGHSSPTVTQRYAHFDLDSLRGYMDTLGAVLREG